MRLLPFLLAVSFAVPASADIRDADEKFEKNLYQEALLEYEKAAQESASPEARLKALYRACESEALLFRYGNAVERFRKISLPESPQWRSRFLLLKTELYREFKNQYGAHAREDVVEDDKEVFRLTPKELQEEVDQAYWELWKLKEHLAKRRIVDEAYFLDVAKSDREVYPTLLDLVLYRWTGYLLGEAGLPEEKPKPNALSFVGQTYKRKVSPSLHPTALAAALMEEGSGGGGPRRGLARELWRIRRLLIGFKHPGRVSPFKDLNNNVESAAGILTTWQATLDSPGGRAMAGFEAASLLNTIERFEDSVSLCKSVHTSWPETLGGRKCERLLAVTRQPSLDLSGRQVPPPGRAALTIGSKNLAEVHLRLYRTTPEELVALGEELRTRRGWRSDATWSQALNRPTEDMITHFLEQKTPAWRWSVQVESRSIYHPATTTVDLPDASPGIYLVAASGDDDFAPGASLLSGAIINVTDLVLVGTSGIEGFDRDLIFRPEAPAAERTLNGFHLYLINGRSGKPVVEAPIALKHQGEHRQWRDADLTTDLQGRSQWAVKLKLFPRARNSFGIDPLAGDGGHWAYWANGSYLGFAVPAQAQLFIETDRPIYRPGQKVRYKVTVTQRNPRGYETYSGPDSVDIQIRDANWQEIHKESKKAGPQGTLSGEFLIPTGRLLGRHTITAQIRVQGQHYSQDIPFSVEEYKRPEFEANLEEAEGAWRFGREAQVKGSVKYYFGGPVPDAVVEYKVFRESYLPWFCWWWAWRVPGGGREEILAAQTRTDKDGVFSFSFTPRPQDRYAPDPLPARFIVEAAARDSGGRTIQAEKSYLAGQKAYLFKITPDAGFALAGGDYRVETQLVNLNGDPLSGEARFTLHRLEKDPQTEDPSSQWGGRFAPSPSLEQIYANVENGEQVAQGDISFEKKAPGVVLLEGLKAGAYRLTLSVEDPWGEKTEQSIIVLSADLKAKKLPLKIHSLSLAERKSYAVGETARMLLGSAELAELTHVEIWGGSFLLKREALRGGGISLFELPLTARHKGGVTVRWFGVQDFKPRSGALTLLVPWREKELKVALKYDKVLKPGQKADWSLSVRDAKGGKVTGEATVRMFDRSLEYYAKEVRASVSSLYSPRPVPNGGQGSLYAVGSTQIRIIKGVIKKIYELFQKSIDEPVPPGLRLNQSRAGFGGYGRHRVMAMGGAAMELSEGMAPMALMAKAAPKGPMTRDEGEGNGERKKDGAAPEPEAKVRKDFSETAVFEPHLKILSGLGKFSFQAPERLTSWRVSGNVLTSDVRFGDFSEEAVTKKELMVRVELPRFFREGDQGTLKAVVHNETDREMTGTLTLALLEEGKPAESALGLKDLSRDFKVRSHGLETYSWPITVPAGLTEYKVRAVARAGRRVDAEERDLPILPSRQRLIESLVVALNGSARKVLDLRSLTEDDPTRRSELLQLQIDPQLILTVLNSLPLLVSYPHECVEQTLNRYVPLAIVSALYKNHPAIAQAAAKIPPRDTITPAWEKDDPKRMMQLMETPWLQVSQGRKSPWPVIDLFDDKVVSAQKKDAFEKLKAAQLPSGGFPWFPGGREDPYITLYVLAGLSEAAHYGVAVPQDIVSRALGYLMNEMPLHLKPQPHHVSLVLYAAYVVTSFPDALTKTHIREFGSARKFARGWLDFADKHVPAMTKLGKAYAAYAYGRMGERPKEDLYLQRAMDGLREDPMAGAYWQPEKNSWLWYNDTLETHAFMIRMLQTARPKDERIPGLVQWLIFNRKGSEWKSTKASAAAIYTLLDFLKKRGALARGDTYTVDWGGVKDAVSVAPEDWMERPLRWTRNGTDITAKYAHPDIDKKGPGLAFASLTHVYSTERLAEATEGGMLDIRRKFYRRVKQGKEYHLKLVGAGDEVRVGDEIEVRLTVKARAQFEYVHLKDPRGAGFEAETLTSGWKWDQLGRYEEPRDSLTNFFVSWLPHGEYVLRYRVRPTTPGTYRIGAAVLQSMYSPEFAAHSSGFTLKVVQ